MSDMTPEEAADQWLQANPPPPLSDEQVTALRALLGVETLAAEGVILRPLTTSKRESA